jgi:hypothetical protein
MPPIIKPKFPPPIPPISLPPAIKERENTPKTILIPNCGVKKGKLVIKSKVPVQINSINKQSERRTDQMQFTS